MERDLFEELMERGSDIVVDEHMLSSSYVPLEIVKRDEQMGEIVPTLNVVTDYQVPRHLFLFGSNGTGKTVTIKYILRRLRDYAKFRSVYIYGSQKVTVYSVLKEIASELGCITSERLASKGDVINAIHDVMRAVKVPTIIVLDECDYYEGVEYAEILHALIGDHGTDAPRVCVISIANNIRIVSGMTDAKVASRYRPKNVEFPAYNRGELFEILRDRENAFSPGMVDPAIFSVCADIAFKSRNGDARYALELLLEAADLARRNDEKKVTVECVRKAEHKIELDFSLRPIMTLADKPRDIFLTIASSEEMRIKDVVEVYNISARKNNEKQLKESNVSYYLGVLEKRGLIERIRRGKVNGRGVDWFVSVAPDINREEILKAYDA